MPIHLEFGHIFTNREYLADFLFLSPIHRIEQKGHWSFILLLKVLINIELFFGPRKKEERNFRNV
ncbi:hypothetical protein QR98_0060930 [Sarcoptes scabiei]|uniref:Uncharacterized protein n=1 Tax=Sarcoptes scabiei TaxID=52283 RepID=A0A132AAH6_SARSC|nr:hypothetical protein QR98_0060930 [Sarcoptes scabiei]